MRNISLVTTAAAVLSITTSVWATDCTTKLQTLNEQATADKTYQTAMRTGLHQEVRRLYDTAQTLASNGQEASCMEVVKSIETIVSKQHTAVMKQDWPHPYGTGYETWHKIWQGRLKKAQPVADVEASAPARWIMGMSLRNLQNEYLGHITDLVVRGDRVAYAVVAFGGFLGIAEHQVAVPWSMMRVVTWENNMWPVLDASQHAVKNAPRFKPSADWSPTDVTMFRKKNAEYFSQLKP